MSLTYSPILPVAGPGGDLPFSFEDKSRVMRDETLILHTARARSYERRCKRMGLDLKPYSREEIERRAFAFEWQSDNNELEQGGNHLNEAPEILMEKRGVDPKRLAEIRNREIERRTRPETRNGGPTYALDISLDTALGAVDYEHVFYQEMRLAGKLVPLFSDQVDILQGYSTKSFTILGDMLVLKQGAMTATGFNVNTPYSPTSTSQTMTPVKVMAVGFLSGELTEDSVAPIIPGLERAAQRGLNVAFDHMILNGDVLVTTANINNYGTTALGTYDARLCFNGLRALNYKGTHCGSSAGVFGGLDVSNAIPTMANHSSVLAAMGKYADDPSKVITVCPTRIEKEWQGDSRARPDTYTMQVVKLADGKIKSLNGSNIVTLGNSLIVNTSSSQVPNYASFLSEGYPVNLNAAGVYDASTVNRTGWVCFREDNFRLAWKRHLDWRIVQLPIGDQYAVVVSARMVMQAIIDNEGIGVAFNAL